MSVAVEPTQPQRALLKANAIRLANGRTFRQIEALPFRSSCLLAATVLRNPTEEQQAMRLRRLLGSVRAFGPSKVDRLLRRVDIRADPQRRVRELTERQRYVLAYALEHSSR